MMKSNIFLQSLLIIIIILSVFFLESIQLIFSMAFIFISISVILQISQGFTTNLLLVWQVAFVYIVGLESLLHHQEILFMYGDGTILASKYIVITFLLSILGYLFGLAAEMSSNKIRKTEKSVIEYSSSVLTVVFLLSSISLFFYANINNAISAFYSGKIAGTWFKGNLAFFLNTANRILSMTLPAIFAFSFRYVFRVKKPWVFGTLSSLPIFAMLFLFGYRFPLLFSLGSFLVVLFWGIRIKFKHVAILSIALFLMIYSGHLMRASRGVGLANYSTSNYYTSETNLSDLLYSREGITGFNSLLIDYFRNNPHTFGKSSSFLLLFWIPRIIWENKPKMLGYWLIREMPVAAFGEGYNVDFGFAGDAYADFGFGGGMTFALLWGVIIQLLDRRGRQSLNKNINILFYAPSYPFVFFAFRSIQTSLITFIGMLLLIWVFKKTLSEKKFPVQESNHT